MCYVAGFDKQIKEKKEMPKIALYNLLKRIPDVTDDEVEKAVSDVASTKDVATKSDLAGLETRLVKQMYAVAGIVIASVGLIVTLVGLMIKFL